MKSLKILWERLHALQSSCGPFSALMPLSEHVLGDEPDVRGPFGEAAHVPGEPVFAVADQAADADALSAELLLAPGLDAEQHREFIAALGHIAVADDLLEPGLQSEIVRGDVQPVSYTHLRAHETPEHLVCRLLLEKK